MRKRNNKKISKVKKSNGLSIPRQIADGTMIEVGYYHNLIDYTNDARDLFTQIAGNSNDYSQYRDIYANFKIVSVRFETIPAFAYTVTPSDNAVGLFAVRQGIFEASPATQSVTTVVAYPGSRRLHNYKTMILNIPVNNGDWFTNVETNSLSSRIAKLTYYCSWYRLASTNTAQGIVQVKVVMAARCRLV